jgi:hypothetical protein
MNEKEFLVSAAGFEPATHALKERASPGLPRIFNSLRSCVSLQIGVGSWWSGLSRYVNTHCRERSCRVVEALAFLEVLAY